MRFTRWRRFMRLLSERASNGKPGAGQPYRRGRFQPTVEGLEDRRLMAAPGSIDASFAGGLIRTDFGTGRDMTATSVAVQKSDGKIVVAGFTTTGGFDFAVARFNVDGTPDTTFGTGGLVLTDFVTGAHDEANAVEIDDKGRITVAGWTGPAAQTIPAGGNQFDINNNFAVVRYDSTGKLDTGFNATGKLMIDFLGIDDRATSIAIQPDRKILIGGYASTNLSVQVTTDPITGENVYTPQVTNPDFGLARVLEDGTQDSDFDADGRVQYDVATQLTGARFVGSDDLLNAIAVQPNGQIVVAGSTDITFNLRAIHHQLSNVATPPATQSQRDLNRDKLNAIVSRINGLDGTLDSSFSGGGINLTDYTNLGTSIEGYNSVAIEASGRITAGGTTNYGGGGSNFFFGVYTTGGAVDRTFNADGLVATDFSLNFAPNVQDASNAISLRPNGKFLLGGSSTRNGTSDFALARYGSNGLLDPVFDPDPDSPFTSHHGQVVTDFTALAGGAAEDVIRGIDVQENGRIVTVGSSTVGGRTLFALARYKGTNENLPTISITKAGDPTTSLVEIPESATDAARVARFAVTLSRDPLDPVTVEVLTADRTATAASGRYVALSPNPMTLTFTKGGPLTQIIEIPINNDSIKNGNQDFVVDIRNPVNAEIALFEATGRIIDDDGLATMQLTADSFTVNESAGQFVISLTRSGVLDQETSVTITTQNGSAIAGTDYATLSTKVTFAPGATSATAILSILDDTLNQATQTLTVTLSAADPAATAQLGAIKTATISILDNDPLPNLSIDDGSVKEVKGGFSVIEFPVRLSAATSFEVRVNYATADGVAKAGSDYVAKSGLLVFAPGETVQTVRVTVIGDNVAEQEEKFVVNISLATPTTAVLVDPKAEGTIVDAASTSTAGDGSGTGGGTGTTTDPAVIAARTARQQFVEQVYLDLLGRAVDTDGEAYWVSILEQGATRSQVVLGIQTSTEYKRHAVNDLYRRYLKREGDDAGLSSFAAALTSGATIEQVAAVIIGSKEYIDKNAKEGFLTALYRDVLGRAPDQGGLVAFTNALSSGTSATQVALLMLTSDEYRMKHVREHYVAFLRRPADTGGEAFFVSALKQGARDEQVIAAILASDEYATLATRLAAQRNV